MRIDDDNKIVWCSESEMEWYVSFNNTMIGDMKRIADLSTEKEMIMRFNVDLSKRLQMINAIAEGYKFKVTQQKYYLRKKQDEVMALEQENEKLQRELDAKVYKVKQLENALKDANKTIKDGHYIIGNMKKNSEKIVDNNNKLKRELARVKNNYDELYKKKCDTKLKEINSQIGEEVDQQKCYWRKKKEHLAPSEKLEEQFLNIDCIDDRLFLSTADKEWQEVSTIKCVFTEQEARELLKDDFNMFEKVECD